METDADELRKITVFFFQVKRKRQSLGPTERKEAFASEVDARYWTTGDETALGRI